MIIDLILNRKDGIPYNAKRFYNDVAEYQLISQDASDAIGQAMDGGTNNDVQRELCRYIDEYGYNMAICDYINGQNWLDNDGLELTRVIDAGGSSYNAVF